MLADLQQWLAKMIAQPPTLSEKLPKTSPFGTSTIAETEKYIADSKTLKPYQRLEIYHQQYWRRLLKVLQTNFPMVTRLFGTQSFNQQLAIPYLTTFPPHDWALCRLGETFPKWIDENYRESDNYLISTSARIDWATGFSFWCGDSPSVDFSQLSDSERLTKKLLLKPHIHLFALKGDFFSFRDEFIKNDIEYYNTHPFPEMIYGEFYFVLYRSLQHVVRWQQISQGEYEMLLRFQKGSSIEEACNEIESQNGTILEEAYSQIPFWFKQWTVLQWFGQF